jgi:hypothetical protein
MVQSTLLLRLFRPLQCARLPPLVQPVVAPLQALHIHFLGQQLDHLTSSELTAALRPVLLPSECWSNTIAWKHNLYLISWLRSLYIGSLPSTRALLPGAPTLLQGDFLPNAADVRRYFSLELPDGRPLSSSARDRAQARQRRHDISPSTQRVGSTHALPFQEVLEGVGGMVSGRGALSIFCEQQGIYQVLTVEMVDELAKYIASRLPALRADRGASEVKLLEVGAGNGELTHWLRKALHVHAGNSGWRLDASDNGSWSLPGMRFGDVHELSYRTALRQFSPQLVITSWSALHRL